MLVLEALLQVGACQDQHRRDFAREALAAAGSPTARLLLRATRSTVGHSRLLLLDEDSAATRLPLLYTGGAATARGARYPLRRQKR